jgi:ribonuclease J
LGVPFDLVHTSGHASPPDLIRFANALNPSKLVAVHTFAADRFPELFDNVLVAGDGLWMEC